MDDVVGVHEHERIQYLLRDHADAGRSEGHIMLIRYMMHCTSLIGQNTRYIIFTNYGTTVVARSVLLA